MTHLKSISEQFAANILSLGYEPRESVVVQGIPATTAAYRPLIARLDLANIVSQFGTVLDAARRDDVRELIITVVSINLSATAASAGTDALARLVDSVGGPRIAAAYHATGTTSEDTLTDLATGETTRVVDYRTTPDALHQQVYGDGIEVYGSEQALKDDLFGLAPEAAPLPTDFTATPEAQDRVLAEIIAVIEKRADAEPNLASELSACLANKEFTTRLLYAMLTSSEADCAARTLTALAATLRGFRRAAVLSLAAQMFYAANMQLRIATHALAECSAEHYCTPYTAHAMLAAQASLRPSRYRAELLRQVIPNRA